MFLFTIATGLVASLFRILQGVFFGLIYLGRCDKCVLMSGFESMDRGKCCHNFLAFLDKSLDLI